MTRSFWLGSALALAGALVLLLAAGGTWVAAEQTRDVGGVVVREPLTVPGTGFAPVAVVVALAALLGGALLGVLRGAPRRLVGIAVAVLGVVGSAAVVVGGVAAAREGGGLTAAPFAALVAAVAIALGGAAAVRGADRPPRASRYRVSDEQAGDEEWRLAAEPDDDTA